MDFSNINLFFNLYYQLPPEMAATTLSCLVQFSAIRRSFFNNNERMKYLNELCLGVKKILETSSVIMKARQHFFLDYYFCKQFIL
jgi:hypothetical protein